MFKKILFGTCLTEYCDHIFNFALNLAKENDAKLWIYHGLGRLNVSAEKVEEAINEAEAHTKELYVERMKKQGFTNYVINVSDGDVVSEMSKLARNAAIDIMVMGTSTEAPIAVGESINVGPLGPVATEILLLAPCPVLIVPTALIPGLARG
ncbi:MAG: universal stress protein [Deltaproteobacteria bacterium]|nr:universal stress protein [Deltaproteobacteria bacterium]